MNLSVKLIFSLLVMLLTGAACNNLPSATPTPVASSQPAVIISSPVANQTVEQGREIQIQSTSIDPQQAIVRVELMVDGQVVWIDANADPKAGSAFVVAQPWTAEVPGNHTIQVKAYNQDNVAGQSDLLPVLVSAPAVSAANNEGQPTATANVAALASADTPVPPSATPAPVNLTPAPTATVTPTPTVTPAPQKFSPTGLEPEGRFNDIWVTINAGDSRLGYPTGPVIDDRDYARQRFEKGMLIWWDNPENPNYIWAIDSPAEDKRSGATSNLYPDTWQGDMPEYSCDQAQDGGPVRGFGLVWCQHSELQGRLGKPVEGERGSGGTPPYAQIQPFQGGAMIYLPLSGEVFVLFAQGDWQRFDY
jgi:hypothetical protein